jgi:hypothetical protein
MLEESGGHAVLALASAVAWASGLNLYGAILALGAMQLFGIVELPGELGLVARPEVMLVAGLLYAVQFVADKIPGVDTLWDTVHTFIRIPAGALLAAAAVGQTDPALHLAALIGGGALALGTHATKASGRLFVNAHAPVVGTTGASLVEDAAVFGGLYFAAANPTLFLVALAILVAAMVVALWYLAKFVGFLLRKLGGLFGRPARL